MKSEPSVFSFTDLKKAKNKTTSWNGVRNYQARNFMMKEMSVGDQVLFYHSSCDEPGVQGIAVIASPAKPDESALDKKSEFFDPKASQENPIWYLVDVKWSADFKQAVSLAQIREEKKLGAMLLIKKGQRLSIQPVTEEEFAVICGLGGVK